MNTSKNVPKDPSCCRYLGLEPTVRMGSEVDAMSRNPKAVLIRPWCSPVPMPNKSHRGHGGLTRPRAAMVPKGGHLRVHVVMS